MSVRPVDISKSKQDTTRSYWGKLLESWYLWFSCRIHITPRRPLPGGDIPDAPPGRHSGLKSKYVQLLIGFGLLFDLSSDLSCYQQSATAVTPQVLSNVVSGVRPSESVDNSHRSLRWKFDNSSSWHNAKDEHEAKQLFIAVTINLLHFR